jgi:hypothetical protein
MCGGGHCVPNRFVPDAFVDRLATCDDMSKCVPDRFIETLGEIIPPTCRSVSDFGLH